MLFNFGPYIFLNLTHPKARNRKTKILKIVFFNFSGLRVHFITKYVRI